MERREALTPGTCHAMQFQVGDRFTDEKGEREVTNRPPSGWSRCSQPGSWPLSASSAPHLVCDLSSCPVRLAAVGSGRAHRRDRDGGTCARDRRLCRGSGGKKPHGTAEGKRAYSDDERHQIAQEIQEGLKLHDGQLLHNLTAAGESSRTLRRRDAV